MLNIEKTTYGNKRIKRSEFVAQRFATLLDQKKVLDVGCFEAPLRKILVNSDYTGVDFVGNPDIEINLQETTRLPFDDNSFDTVFCIDVLEHLDNLHTIFEELSRVSSKNIIVSLPNCWRDARTKIERGRGSFAHYGLPSEAPKDRHRWFFNISQAQQFFKDHESKLGLTIQECFVTEQKKNGLVSFLRHIRYPGERYINRYAQTIWVVYAKKDK
jgi:2-polyprenyl-3-methyl-5-hydroxy-6-metoxy-1,4-benzoquinol methylase